MRVSLKPNYLFFLTSLLLLLLIFAQRGLAEDISQLLHNGNEAYSNGDFDRAISIFESITQKSGYSSEILYNLAGSYGQADQIGKAILNYERAIRLTPSDPDIQGNLNYLRKESGLFQTEPKGIDLIFGTLNLNQWAYIFLGTMLFSTGFFITLLRYKISKIAVITVSSLLVISLMLSATGTYFRYTTFNPFVVVTSDSRLLVSPFDSASSVGSIMEGRLVYPLKHHNGYFFVKDESGRKGWIDASLIEEVCKKLTVL